MGGATAAPNSILLASRQRRPTIPSPDDPPGPDSSTRSLILASCQSIVNFIEGTMPAAAALKSPNVCANCKARKKRCDKSLPRCRYCTEYRAAPAEPDGWNTR
ncbi:hypothetical protein N7454_008036 [Penicillium verhagenii]|nr:hypothetical protein N7454_008036 [Penicillium verhagenii]